MAQGKFHGSRTGVRVEMVAADIQLGISTYEQLLMLLLVYRCTIR